LLKGGELEKGLACPFGNVGGPALLVIGGLIITTSVEFGVECGWYLLLLNISELLKFLDNIILKEIIMKILKRIDFIYN